MIFFIDIGDMARTEETYEGHSIVAENATTTLDGSRGRSSFRG